MPDMGEETEIQVVASIGEIEAAAWDACAGSANPTVSHAFLSALEDSGSVTAETGWQPQHLVVRDPSGRVAACAPLYLKSHSYGEYVFDWGWADAYERAGGRYYPKLQSSVPFTPVTGPRLLVRADADPGLADVLIAGMTGLCRQLGVSSVHITFPNEDEWRRFGNAGLQLRTGEQFHWRNDGYATFDDFLAALSSRKRKNIAKERRKVAESGLDIRCLTGKDLTEDIWDHFFRFYLDTSDRKWGQAYLNRTFFSLLGERMADRVMLVTVFDAGEPVAAALNLIGSEILYGRNWGSVVDVPFLHFECCYYQAIDFAIRRGLSGVEAGAQGPHKLQRGYLPTRTYSAHWIRDPRLRDAIEDFLARERIAVDSEISYLGKHSPFRDTEG
ncbi:MAG: GNAT family N-acetyltransferase [Rhodospirillales bacterium]